MKKKFLKLIDEFATHIDWFNRERKQSLEDDVTFTFANFYKWLRWDVTPVEKDLLAPKQREVYEYIKGYIEKNGKSPSYNEIKDLLKTTSLNTVDGHLKALERKKFIIRAPHKKRSIQLTHYHD